MDRSEQTVALVRRIKAEADQVVVIVLTMTTDPQWLDLLFDAGATGAISKATHPAALATLVRETVNGNVVHVHQTARPVCEPRSGELGSAQPSLTSRELEVLQLVAGGATNGEIARTLWVTEQTVKFHLSNVYRKLDVGNRTEASHYAHVTGLVPVAHSYAAP
jgi:DNA-binding NarL/FixJ family response regulator